MAAVARASGIRRFKFVDEALSPAKARSIAVAAVMQDDLLEWEAYARLERGWDEITLQEAHRGGLRKLYFGLEQVPTRSRKYLGKGDHADPDELLRICSETGIAVHLFCMVGHPRTTLDDAWLTVDYLLQHAREIDTADMVGFRLDRGTSVAGVRACEERISDWRLSFPFEPVDAGVLGQDAVAELEAHCQEALWEAAPQLLHPMYRLLGSWSTAEELKSFALFDERPTSILR